MTSQTQQEFGSQLAFLYSGNTDLVKQVKNIEAELVSRLKETDYHFAISLNLKT
jgi:hypothetical protein